MSQTRKLVPVCTAAKKSEKETAWRVQNERVMPNEKSKPLCLRRASCYLNWSDSHPTNYVSKMTPSFELGRSRAYSHSAQCVSWVGPRAQNERVDHPATALSVNMAKEDSMHGKAQAVRDQHGSKSPC
jgi:hypothetical protein